VAAAVTTYGVGELSALNGVAGSYAEDVPVVQVTGMPPSSARFQGSLLHHTLADGDFDHFFRAYREVTAAGAILRARDATLEIDRLLRAALDESKPVYLGVPTDVAMAPVSSAPLQHSLRPSPSDQVALEDFRHLLHEAVALAPSVTVLAGTCVHRRRGEHLLAAIASHPGVRVATLAGAKAMLPESHPASLGIYMGALTVSEQARRAVDEAPLLVCAGTVLSDVMTGLFTHRFDIESVVELRTRDARVGPVTLHNVRLEDSLAVLDEVLGAVARDPAPAVQAAWPYAAQPEADGAAPLTQDTLWSTVQEWLPAGAVVIADAGTALYGSLALRLPEGTELLAQPIWSSIGYTLPAVLGTCLAAPERRSILFIGDGAAQMTAQELATVLHRGLTPIIVLLNNRGYTIERAIRSPRAVYQDVTPWDWSALPAALAPGVPVLSASVTTGDELRAALVAAGAASDRAALIEVHLGPDDAPALLSALGRAVADANSR
jgi:indolepyruvate decarboxylase